jgi:acetyltransferase-like isoleucine patch superfamily enzyme
MAAHISGEIPATVGHTRGYFDIRHTWLDCRGTLKIHTGSHWGFYVKVITYSHTITDGVGGIKPQLIGNVIDRPVTVENLVWIGSGALLYNCIIREGAVVAAGTVVRSCEVGPRVIVAGNPAKVIARWDDGWVYETEKWSVLN